MDERVSVLVLGNEVPLPEGTDYLLVNHRVDRDFVRNFDFIVSYGYRHNLKQDVLDVFPDRAVNLHISYLPWNRGADPNFWSFVDNTPKGVTIHFMDKGIDTGDIIAQREVPMYDDDTLATSYARLQMTIQDLFVEVWPFILNGSCRRMKQPEGGSYHKKSDFYDLNANSLRRLLL